MLCPPADVADNACVTELPAVTEIVLLAVGVAQETTSCSVWKVTEILLDLLVTAEVARSVLAVLPTAPRVPNAVLPDTVTLAGKAKPE